MVYRALALLVTTLALVLFAGTAVSADDKEKGEGVKADAKHRHEGTVVSITGDKLVMKGKAKDGEEAREHTHTLADKAKVTCDGKECKLDDLKTGQRIRVTTKDGDMTIVTRVEALNKNERFGTKASKGIEKPDSDKNER